MVEVKRYLQWPSSPTAPLNQGQLDQFAQEHIQMTFEYLQGGSLHNALGNLCQGCQPPNTNMFSDVKGEPLVFQFVPIASSLITEYHWKEPGFVLFARLSATCTAW